MNYGSVCSGIEAASVAWTPLGWQPQFVSEIDSFPSALLEQRHSSIPNRGDMTKFKDWPDATIDVLVGGTPCQSYSVAGLRGGLADPRGDLMLTYLAIAARYQPEWLVWENVPGVLSSNRGRDFGAFLGGMAELGYGFAYRVLDAQYFNLAQRRQRVFVVGCLGSWQRAAAVLFERASLRGDLAPSREAWKNIAGTVGTSSSSGRSYGSNPIDDNLIAHALRADGFDASEDGTGRGTPLTIAPPLTSNPYGDHESREGLLVPVANTLCGHGGRMGIDETYVPIGFNARQDPDNWLDRTGPLDVDGGSQGVAFAIQAGALRENPESGPDGVGIKQDVAYTIEARAEVQAVAFAQNSRSEVREMPIAGAVAAEPGAQQQTYVAQVSPTLRAGGNDTGGHRPPGTDVDTVETLVSNHMAVRRLTPRECERLQGFEDDYTLITYRGKPATDGPRYKSLGNSMPVPVMRWIGRRIQLVHQLSRVNTIERHAEVA